jgi:hypothetical protein
MSAQEQRGIRHLIRSRQLCPWRARAPIAPEDAVYPFAFVDDQVVEIDLVLGFFRVLEI